MAYPFRHLFEVGFNFIIFPSSAHKLWWIRIWFIASLYDNYLRPKMGVSSLWGAFQDFNNLTQNRSLNKPVFSFYFSVKGGSSLINIIQSCGGKIYEFPICYHGGFAQMASYKREGLWRRVLYFWEKGGLGPWMKFCLVISISSPSLGTKQMKLVTKSRWCISLGSLRKWYYWENCDLSRIKGKGTSAYYNSRDVFGIELRVRSLSPE